MASPGRALNVEYLIQHIALPLRQPMSEVQQDFHGHEDGIAAFFLDAANAYQSLTPNKDDSAAFRILQIIRNHVEIQDGGHILGDLLSLQLKRMTPNSMSPTKYYQLVKLKDVSLLYPSCSRLKCRLDYPSKHRVYRNGRCL